MNNQYNSNGIGDMGGNMNGTPISQLINNFPSSPKQNYFQQNLSDDSTVSKRIQIKKIINELNETDNREKKINKKKIKKKKKDDDNDDNDDNDEIDDFKNNKDDDLEEKKNKNSELKIPDILKDLLLIWIIFIILSNGIIKNFIAKYINAINPDETGIVGFKGIVIYGLLLASSYVLIKLALKHFNKY